MTQTPAQPLSEIFAEFRPRLADPGLTDFSRLRSAGDAFWQVMPRHADMVAGIVRQAQSRNIPLRVRAQGHSLNGASLPEPGELLIEKEKVMDEATDRANRARSLLRQQEQNAG